jgi:hypothetical protein
LAHWRKTKFLCYTEDNIVIHEDPDAVRCRDCAHCPPKQFSRCGATGKHPSLGALRFCGKYLRSSEDADVINRIKAQEQWLKIRHYIVRLEQRGSRFIGIQLRPGLSDAEKALVYEAVGVGRQRESMPA